MVGDRGFRTFHRYPTYLLVDFNKLGVVTDAFSLLFGYLGFQSGSFNGIDNFKITEWNEKKQFEIQSLL